MDRATGYEPHCVTGLARRSHREAFQGFLWIAPAALAQFATDKMDLEQTIKWADEKIKAIYAKFV